MSAEKGAEATVPLFDTHAHLSGEEYDPDRDEVLKKARKNGVRWILDIADTAGTAEKSLLLFREDPDIFTSAGIHPHNSEKALEEEYALIRRLLSNPAVVALGEVGLDYHYLFSRKSAQRKGLECQLAMAVEEKKPVVIHCRAAEEDLLGILKNHDGIRGVAHCFSGSKSFARACLEFGLWISLSGILTFPKASELKEVAAYVPLDKLLIETDSPYLAPVPDRGKRNEPALVREVAKILAEIRGKTLEKIAEITTRNAFQCFRLEGEQSVGNIYWD